MLPTAFELHHHNDWDNAQRHFVEITLKEAELFLAFPSLPHYGSAAQELALHKGKHYLLARVRLTIVPSSYL